LDGLVTTAYTNTGHRETWEIPRYATKLVEERKFYADKTSKRPVGRVHGGKRSLVPFAIKDGGRIGVHAQAFLQLLVERVVRQGRRSRVPTRDPSGTILRIDGATQFSLWVQR